MSNLNFSMYNIQTPTSVTNGNYGKLTVAGPLTSGTLNVVSIQYDTGTASQALTTITGVGTIFTAAMVGSSFAFANGVSAGTITVFGSATTLTVSTSQTVAVQAFTISYPPGVYVGSTGNVGIGTTNPLYKLNSIGNIAVSRFGTGLTPVFIGQSAGGTEAAPTAVAISTPLVTLGGRGYNGTAFTTSSVVYVQGKTTEPWSPTATGTELLFATCKNLTITRVEHMVLTNDGNLGIGTITPNANAILDVTSTTKAFMPPRMTTVQKNLIASPTAGMVVYDSTLNKLSVYGAVSWETITSV